MSAPTPICTDCGQPAEPLDWQCTACGGPLWFSDLPPFDKARIRTHDWSLWRYGAMLPAVRQFSLGEGMTPITPLNVGGVPFLAKLEYLMPTGSYKDRGVAVMLNHLLAEGVREVVEDSSGNAGAAVAGYAGNAGLQARVFVPATAPANKKKQIGRFGAELVEVAGLRADVTAACEEAAQQQATYATHAWNPYFLAGQMTGAWETWEQMQERVPAAIVCPTGQGGLLLGWYYGYKALQSAGLITDLPRFYAIQSEAYDSIVTAWEQGQDEPRDTVNGDTIADGIRIARPVRGKMVLAAIRESGGAAFRVADDRIRTAQEVLAHHGVFVEPTSATPVAALDAVQAHLDRPAEIVVPLTGSGLKTSA